MRRPSARSTLYQCSENALGSISAPVVLVNTGVSGATCSGCSARRTRTVSGSSSTVRRALFVFGSP
ncbi:MAG: hypothetical protein HY271_04845 [Deltaproteobacteria bacterium]|nr:hypothetical protein [Deltaproteobacteria bacterium]